MKRILLALTMAGFLLPLVPRAEADTEVSLNFFYDNLADQGSWLEVADYGYVFQPSVAVSSSDWRPYADGYWAYTDAGWTWVSYEDFGWATYHYGRWADLDGYGWVWVPGYEWGPAWVSWRTGGDYVGWAPLPPQEGGVVYEGRAITGNVDVSFGIGPLYYNFVDIRYIGEPVLRGRLIEPSRNVTIINNTVNVTNITVNNTTVINNGPDLNRINQFSTRPIQQLTLQRETNISNEVAGHRGNLNRVNGNTLMVAAPAVQRSSQKIAPRQVKTKVDKPKIEKGWMGINNRQQVEQAMEKENAQNVPPPTFQPQKDRKAEAQGNAGNGDNAGTSSNAGRAQKGNRAEQSATNANNPGQPAAQENQPTDRQQRPQQATRVARSEHARVGKATSSARNRMICRANSPASARRTKAHLDRQSQQSEQEKAQRNQNHTRADARSACPTARRRPNGRRSKRKNPSAQNAARKPSKRSKPSSNAWNAHSRRDSSNSSSAREQAQQRQEAQHAQQPQPPPRAQQPQQDRRPEQARPRERQQKPDQSPNEERTGKKKRPADEPSPQSSPSAR
jgi:hypothetical protein